ncbi:MAG: GumC family protein, partial [Rhizobiales bacterium]|nr:GumC family protein [Hyphomicrobiales bacterium]
MCGTLVMAMRETPSNASGGTDGDLDFRAIGAALWRRRLWVLIPTAIALILSFAVVSMMTPRYKSEARVLYEGRESVFLRPEAERQGDRSSAIDPETITSQVQLVLSREVARQVIGQLRLNEKPEFDPVLRGIGMVKQIFIIAGLAKDPLRMSPEERVFESFYERVQAYQVDKSRVIAIEFWSTDPELAANVANAIADSYIEQQQQARLDQTRAAGSFLAGEIESLRQKVADAEAKAAEFRAKSNLFVGTNNNILSTQQLGESSSQLAVARTQQAESEAKARLIREMLKSGKPIEYGDIINSELIRRLNEQRITLRAQLAEQSSTLLGNHPRIKELRAQITDLERQIREEAERLVRSFENDAKIASARMEQASAGLDKLKLAAASSNGDDVQLRALEREAKAQRDLLESYLAKYREASARENLGASIGDARVISHAIVSNTPYFPKKLPIVLMATFATMFLGVGLITTGELLASSGAQPYGPRSEAEPDAAPQKDEAPRLLAPPAPQPGAVVPETSVSAAADRLRATPDGRSRDIVLGLTADVQSAATAIVLARALA